VLSTDTIDRQNQRDQHIRLIAVKGRMGWQGDWLRTPQPRGNDKAGLARAKLQTDRPLHGR
jgi:hypothetical protein